MGDKKLLKDLKKGKEEAYYELINLYGDKLLSTCFLMIKDKGEAEDIVQETFIKVFKYIHSFKGDSSIYTWIYRISQNITKDKLRTKLDTIHFEDIVIAPEDTEKIILTKIDREVLRNELEKLNFIYKQVLVLFYFDDLSIKEISEILEEKEGTIKSKLSRARVLLKESLEKGGKLNG